METEHLDARRAYQKVGVSARVFPAEFSPVLQTIALGAGRDRGPERVPARVRILAEAIHVQGPASSDQEADIRAIAQHSAGGPAFSPIAGRQVFLALSRCRIGSPVYLGGNALSLRGAGRIIIKALRSAVGGVDQAVIPRTSKHPQQRPPFSSLHHSVVVTSIQ